SFRSRAGNPHSLPFQDPSGGPNVADLIESGTMATAGRKRWSQRVAKTSNALDLESGVFTKGDPGAIALSLKRSAEKSRRRKSDPFRSAMSMLNFYINRAGRALPRSRKSILDKAKAELRKQFGKQE